MKLQRPRTFRGWVIAILGGTVAFCCIASLMLAGITNVGQRVGVLPTWTPTLPPTETPIPTETFTPGPTDMPDTPEPTATDRPTRTPIPTRTPRATSTPAPTRDPTVGLRGGTDSAPLFFGEGRSREVDPPWWPCLNGQVKGNDDSMIYHRAGGAFYSNTFEGVTCFNTAADAETNGYRASER